MSKGEIINAVYKANLSKRATLVILYFLKRESWYHEKGGQRSNYFTILKGELEIKEVNLFEIESKEQRIIENEQKEKEEKRFKISVFQRVKQSLSAYCHRVYAMVSYLELYNSKGKDIEKEILKTIGMNLAL
ncbi:hypothetical protein HZI73_16840 [Vallitalea pronyensis]|uniref:Uncharacterized protein n=1 Tax=Vallitalea pronyensis TaxID=1348613 RepID=A0A8J8MM00_9FIRM|nr:hypothetical protein [Vallitalea pronyensis]QUI23857.1 hypothetical protein HZI73_16840 [Vallitalea pronyensis]